MKLKSKLAAAFGVLALVGGAVVATSSTASASSTTITAYVINGNDAGDGTMSGYSESNTAETPIDDYYWYEDLSVGIWNSDPQGAETWGGDAVNLVESSACPAQGDYCIYVSTADLTSLNICGYGGVYTPNGLAPGDGYRGYIVVGSNCSGYTQEQRISILTHEFGHAMGIPYDPSTDPTDLMSDVVFPTVQVPDYGQYQDVGEFFASGGSYHSNAH